MNRTEKLMVTALAGATGALALRIIQRRNRIDLEGRTVVITGGSRGLGLVLAREFANEGANLALLARNETELTQARQELADWDTEVLAIPCDIRNQEQVRAAIQQIANHYGRIDVLVNNAGVIQVGPLEHMTIEDFKEAMAVHTWGSLYTMLAVIPHMRRQGGGRIVNISSIGGKVAVPHLLPYVTSKFALAGLSDGMRAELAKYGILVTTVIPGLMRTASYFNAFFKGQHQDEFTWFAIFDALPITSTSARNAARQIVEACRNGKSALTITIQARLLEVANTLFPDITAMGMRLFNQALPGATGEGGKELKTGWESQSAWAPSLLTRMGDRVAEKNNELRGHAPPVT